jgi:phosphoribosylaminoimidazole (AIR) synthetase
MWRAGTVQFLIKHPHRKGVTSTSATPGKVKSAPFLKIFNYDLGFFSSVDKETDHKAVRSGK